MTSDPLVFIGIRFPRPSNTFRRFFSLSENRFKNDLLNPLSKSLQVDFGDVIIKLMKKEYIRQPLFDKLWSALTGQVNFIQVIVGPRQVGKTTLALQILDRWPGPKIYQTADQPSPPGQRWLIEEWEKARALEVKSKKETLLIIDEIQKISRWSEIVKKMFDEDKRKKRKIKPLLLGSSSLLVQKGLTESLAGRFELHRHYQWSYEECREAFSLNFNQYIYFGGYPGALGLIKDQERWADFIRNSLIETVLAKDVLLMSSITKPALLRQIFGLSVSLPAQILSYQKMLGTLQEVGNTTTIASYLRLLANAFLILSLEKYSGSIIKQKGSTPKLIAFDNGLISAMSGRNFQEVLSDESFWGRMIENAVGASLYKEIEKLGGQLFYWRDRSKEVDFIIRSANKIIAIEVKSRVRDEKLSGLTAFSKQYPGARALTVSTSKTGIINGISNLNFTDFFLEPVKVLS